MKQVGEATLVLGLGGNLGGEARVLERMNRVAEAVVGWAAVGAASWTAGSASGAASWAAVGGAPAVTASAVYRTAALGPPQPDYLNAALHLRLAPPPWQPVELMTAVLELELLLGRDRRGEERWGPRTIDLDVLVWGTRVARYEGPPLLEVPHPRAHRRRFALAPLADVLDEDTELPGSGQSLRQLLEATRDQRVEPTDLRISVG